MGKNPSRGLYMSALLSVILSACLTLSACATSDPWNDNLMPRSDENANPNPAAMGNDAMMLRRPMPLGNKNANNDFFFKRCEQTSGSSYYSKTAYDCGDRP